MKPSGGGQVKSKLASSAISPIHSTTPALSQHLRINCNQAKGFSTFHARACVERLNPSSIQNPLSTDQVRKQRYLPLRGRGLMLVVDVCELKAKQQIWLASATGILNKNSEKNLKLVDEVMD
jgi:hypothetical protein